MKDKQWKILMEAIEKADDISREAMRTLRAELPRDKVHLGYEAGLELVKATRLLYEAMREANLVSDDDDEPLDSYIANCNEIERLVKDMALTRTTERTMGDNEESLTLTRTTDRVLGDPAEQKSQAV